MALGSIGGFELPYFTKKKALRKVNILDKVRNDSELMSYIPDDININSLTRDFLLSVLMTGSQDKYFSLYKQYKEIMAEKEDKRLIKYVLPISETLKNKLMEYSPVDV